MAIHVIYIIERISKWVVSEGVSVVGLLTFLFNAGLILRFGLDLVQCRPDA